MSFDRINELLKRSWRILVIARKPTSDELKKIITITGAGIVFLGLLGLIVSFLFHYL